MDEWNFFHWVSWKIHGHKAENWAVFLCPWTVDSQEIHGFHRTETCDVGPICKSAVFTQRVETGGGSKNKELSCCLARKQRRLQQGRERRETAGRHQGCHFDFCRFIPVHLHFSVLSFSFFFFFFKGSVHQLPFTFLMGDSCCFSALLRSESHLWGKHEGQEVKKSEREREKKRVERERLRSAERRVFLLLREKQSY